MGEDGPPGPEVKYLDKIFASHNNGLDVNFYYAPQLQCVPCSVWKQCITNTYKGVKRQNISRI